MFGAQVHVRRGEHDRESVLAEYAERFEYLIANAGKIITYSVPTVGAEGFRP